MTCWTRQEASITFKSVAWQFAKFSFVWSVSLVAIRVGIALCTGVEHSWWDSQIVSVFDFAYAMAVGYIGRPWCEC